MRISFHGAAHTVTGSQDLIEVNGARLLLDCGLFQGRRADTYERNLNFSHDPRKVDAVVPSHAYYERKCEVATIGGLSAHAGQDLLGSVCKLRLCLSERSEESRFLGLVGDSSPLRGSE